MHYEPELLWNNTRDELRYREWLEEVSDHVDRALDLLVQARCELVKAFGQGHEIIDALDDLGYQIEAECAG